jgi:hypothetical protein
MIRLRFPSLFATIAFVGLLIWSGFTTAQDAKQPEMPALPKRGHVRFLEPVNGSKIANPVKLRFTAVGIKTLPAGVVEQGAGHHHLIIDALPQDYGVTIPADEKHIHFGKGQKEAELQLAPGLHTLTLQFADGLHRSYGPRFRDTIIIEVTK